jgi:large conductance mechanosensitive channel
MIKEFKEFAVSGSVVDLAVGIVIGAAFKGIIDSFVADILTPLLGLVTGGIDFTNRFLALNGVHYATLAEAKKAGAATLNYGLFVNAVLNFVIVAFALFLVVKRILKARKAEGTGETGKTG